MTLVPWMAAVATLVIPFTSVEAALAEAGKLTSVYTSASLFDARDGSDNGCDPVGCIGVLTRLNIHHSCSVEETGDIAVMMLGLLTPPELSR